jgi:hypothetical protein
VNGTLDSLLGFDRGVEPTEVLKRAVGRFEFGSILCVPSVQANRVAEMTVVVGQSADPDVGGRSSDRLPLGQRRQQILNKLRGNV